MKKLIILILVSFTFILNAQNNKFEIKLANITGDTIYSNHYYRILPQKGYNNLSYGIQGQGAMMYESKGVWYVKVLGAGYPLLITAIYKHKSLGKFKTFFVKDF